ncbi:MAG TPA: hypothetical protein VLZ07_10640 [Syntrophales bacterium]|nr:hypothetical protein [Syntrophales bacterium]
MSRKLPNYQEKQHILYIKSPSEKDLVAYGDAFLEEGKTSDAAEFYQKASYAEGLLKIKGMALESGDVMLLQQVMKPLRQSVTDETWNVIGQRATDLGKYEFARYAFEKSGNESMVAKVMEMIKAEVDVKHQ